MRLPSLSEALWLHGELIKSSGGAPGLRDLGALLSALAQPMATFGGEDLYPTILEKAAALAFSIVTNHAFVDGNKRLSHALLETTLMLNGLEISASIDEQEALMLGLASGSISRDYLVEWLTANTRSPQ